MSEQELLPISGQGSVMSRLGPVEIGVRGIQLRTMEDVFRFAKAVSGSKLCPPGFTETDCFLIIEAGLELGLSPITALQSVYVVNNRAALFGDMPLALVRQSGLLEDYKQEYVGQPYDDDFRCIVSSKRKGMAEALTTEYSVSDAKKAGVWDKRPSPWVTAPKRMLMFRARGFNLRDNFGDVLKGCAIGELDDGENLPGFENAKVAKVVEPNFQTPKAEAAPPTSGPGILSPEQPEPKPEQPAPKRRGRPSKAPEPPTPIDKPTRENLEDHPQPNTPETESEALAKEVAKRLDAEGIALTDFLLIMQRNAYLEGEIEDIKFGRYNLHHVDPDGLDAALKQWPDVVARLKSGGNK